MLSADIPPEHIPLNGRYEILGEALTDAGRVALARQDGGHDA